MENMKNVFALFLTLGTPIGVGTFLSNVTPILQVVSLLIGISVGLTILYINMKKIKKIKKDVWVK